jgi:hypothetical protein
VEIRMAAWLLLLVLLTPPAPSVTAAWTSPTAVRVEWRGPGLLVAPCGGGWYMIDEAADDAPRVVTLQGGDVCAAPWPGMTLAITDRGYNPLASATVGARPPPVWRVWAPVVLSGAGPDVPR